MTIPSNITREHVLKAIERIDEEGIPPNGRSAYYDLVEDGKRYPPKLVLSYANLFANGEELDRNNFTGGAETPAFQMLKKLGFSIEDKPSGYFEELEKFLAQAKTGDLKTKHFKKAFQGLEVNVSFGQGNQAIIPWISFLKPPNTTQNGIYPGYLYYKKEGKLILGYCVSEKNSPGANWNLSNPKTIFQYFREKGLGTPRRYGDSYVFQAYDVDNLPSAEKIDADLAEIIDQYKVVTSAIIDPPTPTLRETQNDLFQNHISEPTVTKQETMNLDSFRKVLRNAGLIYSDKLVTRFVSSLVTKPFVILTGLSGSGKTKLAQAFTQWISQDEGQYCIVPVGADWTNREPLLGYPNALKPEEYVKPDNGVLDLIMQANEQEDLPFFLILDEMNLSHVERYFADFLSVMESKESIPLFAEETVDNGVPANLSLPPNLFIIGTVNIDETTNMFSPKVLDRANTIEFRVTEAEIAGFLNNMKTIDMAALTSKGASMGKSFLATAGNRGLADIDLEEINKTMVAFFGQLKKTGAEFGYRSASEILRLINQLTALDASLTTNEKIDIAIMQKLLPKLHGSRRKLAPVLSILAGFCVTEEIGNVEKEIFEKEDFDFENSPGVKYPLSLEKIARMHKGAVDNGFASFAEA